MGPWMPQSFTKARRKSFLAGAGLREAVARGTIAICGRGPEYR